MGESRYARRPLLYIQQPSILAPQAEMQSSYRSESREKVGRVKRVPKDERNIFHEQLLGSKRNNEPVLKKTVPIEDVAQEESFKLEETVQQLNDVKIVKEEQQQKQTPFKNLDLRGKIDYFLKKPAHLPALKCEIRSSGQIHHGVVIDFKEENVYIRKKRQTELVKIPFDSIESIRMLGF